MSVVVQMIDKIEGMKQGDGDGGFVAEEEDTYNVTIDKPMTESLFGLGYRVTDKGEVYICSVAPTSLIEEWNANCEVDQTVCAGDRLLSVNRKTNARSIVEEMKSEHISATFMKTGPRWHIHGITADSMEKIGAAQNKGLAFELQDADAGDAAIEEPPINWVQLLVIFLMLGLPSIITVALLSDTGAGFKVFELFAPKSRNMIGNLIVFIGSVFTVGLYVADWTQWPANAQKFFTGLFAVYTIVIGAFFKMRFYPQVPIVCVLFHIPVFIAMFRATILRATARKSFYRLVTGTLLFWAVLILMLWLVWIFGGTEGEDGWAGKHTWDATTKDLLVKDSAKLYDSWKITLAGDERETLYPMDCDYNLKASHICSLAYCGNSVWSFGGSQNFADDPSITVEGFYCCQADTKCKLVEESAMCPADAEYMYLTRLGRRCCDKSRGLSSDAKLERSDNCAKVKTVWFLLWVTPFVTACINGLLGLFALANGVWLNTADSGKLEKVMKQFTLMTFVLLLMMWVSIAVAGASMRLTGTLLAFCLAGLVSLVIWVYLEIGTKVITISVQNSRLMQSLIGLATSDWIRAMLIIGLNILIPLALLVNLLNQSVRRLRGAARSEARFTDGMQKVLNNLSNWNWCSILIKVNWLILLYWVLSVGVAKLTQVFLSWLNKTLLSISFGVVIVIFFIIGFIMFMLPPVPGLPVYMSSGIVMSSRARDIDGVGFVGGTIIACALSLVLKLTAVVGQYGIGYFLGKSVKIQQMVGVDKVFIRAVQLILEKRGIPLSKVAVLVGGPDWPTSVLCGILKLSVFQTVLGTIPVIFVSSPVVLAGAFMAGPEASSAANEKKSGVWETLTPVMMGIAALAQLASGVVALYYIQEVIYEHGVELARPRAEHEPVAKLTRAEAEFVKAYNEALDWKKLARASKVMLLISTLGLLFSLFVFLFMDEACFYPFKVTGDISAPYEEEGLNGNVFNIVKWPGWAAHLIFFIAGGMHFSFLRFAKFEANRQMQQNKKNMEALVAEGTIATESEEKRRPTLRVSSLDDGAPATGGRKSTAFKQAGEKTGFQPQRASMARSKSNIGKL